MGQTNSGNQGKGNFDDQNQGKKQGYESGEWKDPKRTAGREEANRNLGSDVDSNRDREQRNLSGDRSRDVTNTGNTAAEGRGRFNEEDKSRQDMARGGREENQDIQDSRKDQNLSGRANFDADEEV